MSDTHNRLCCNCCCQEPMGPQGETGHGVQPSYFNAVMQGGFQTILPEGDVNFLLAFQSGDF